MAAPQKDKPESLLPSMAPTERTPVAVAPVEANEQRLTADLEIAALRLPEEEREGYLKEVQRIAALRKFSFGTMSQKLALPVRPGYHRHWFNDSPGRIEEAESNGWTKIKDKTGKIVRRVVGSGRDGGALSAFAMEIPEVFWEREMKARFDQAQARMDDVRKNPIRAPAGSAQPSDAKAFYSPHEEVLSVRDTLAVQRRQAGQ